MTVLNKHKLPGKAIPAGAVYIGRGSMWGNPFVMGSPRDRDHVCDQHEKYLLEQIRTGQITTQQLAALHGKDLVCFCAPLRCHGDTLARYAAQAHTNLALDQEPDDFPF